MRVHLSTGQATDQGGVDGASEQFAAFGMLARTLHLVEQKGDLGAGEIGIKQQADPFSETRFQLLLLELGTERGGAPILPDDGIVYRLAGGFVPNEDGHALVGYADCGYSAAFLLAFFKAALRLYTMLSQISSGLCST